MTGELPVTLEFPHGPDPPSFLSGGHRWRWTAHFEGFASEFDTGRGRLEAYEVSTGGEFTRSAAAPIAGGQTASIPLPGAARRITVRAVDEQGNKGRPEALRLR